MSQYPTNERGLRLGPGNGTFGESPASGPAPTTAGFHTHDIMNKLDPRVDSTQDRRPMATIPGPGGGNNIPEGTYGPHRSRVANALDPRVDSDMDGRGAHAGAAAAGVGGGGIGGGGMGGGTARHVPPTAPGAHGTHSHGGNNIPEGTYGPHSSRMANALDPRVDSDRDRTVGGAPGGYGQQQQPPMVHGGAAPYGSPYGASQAPGAGVQPSVGLSGPGPAPNTAGPHRSDLLNKLDPRVDSKAGTAAGQQQGLGGGAEHHHAGKGYEGKRGI